MNSEVKAAWVEALRSGDYKQGAHALQRDSKFCCLGVLCELAVKANVIPAAEVFDGTRTDYRYGTGADWSIAALPRAVQEWAGVPSKWGSLTNDLASLNDKRLLGRHVNTFAKIADVIEKEL